MSFILKNAKIFKNKHFRKSDVLISGSVFSDCVQKADPKAASFENCIIIPGLVDVHVHLREPGFVYKETIQTGTKAAAHGGYTVLCTMPNVSPVPDCRENLSVQLNAIKKDAVISVLPYGAITKGQTGRELSDMEGIYREVVAFSDDGKGVQDDELMLRAMLTAKKLGKIIVAHCEDNRFLNGGYINDGEYALKHGHKGICSESEWRQVERDIALVEKTGCAYHICHVSTKESVELIRKAKAKGLNVSCETAPHYLLLNDMDLQEDGRFKMNPPIGSEQDRLALIDGILDGTIDMIATDHAPHSKEEKSKGLAGSLMGVVGLEIAFPVLYTGLVMTNIITLEKLIELMSVNPCRRFGINHENDFTVFDLNSKYRIDPADFISMGKSTPFEYREVYGRCLMTVHNGNVVWQSEGIV